MESVVKTSFERKAMVGAVLRDPENIEKIRRIHRNIISKQFTPQQARLGARKAAIMICKELNTHICKKDNCDSCIGDKDIVQIIGD